MEDIKITSMENHHEMTRELWTKTIFSKVRKDEQALIVVGLHGGSPQAPLCVTSTPSLWVPWG